MKQVWIVTAKNESGDEFGPWAFKNKPTKKQLKELVADVGEEMDIGGPGDFGSYLFLKDAGPIEIR